YQPLTKNDPWGQQQAVRIGKYVGVRVQIKSPDTPLKLYDVTTDAHEDHDLATEPKFKSLVERMKELMITSRHSQPSNHRPYDDAPMPAMCLVRSKPGLNWAIYPSITPWTPDVRYLKPLATGSVLEVSELDRILKPDVTRTVELRGYLVAPATAAYT